MKERIASAIILLALIIPFLIIGGMPFHIGVYVISLLGLREFIAIKETKKQMPLFVKFISYIILTFIMFSNTENSVQFLIDYRVITGAFLVYLIPNVMYHDNSKYSVNDAFFLLGSVFFLGISFSLFPLIREMSIHILIYLLIVTIFSDTFALVTGKLIGKTKLIESISPKKTWEGSIGGTIMAVIVGTMFYIEIINPEIPLQVIIPITLFLSIIAQLGDLVFSSIKRYYGKKDFSNLIPGHGGILDRVDSIIFALIGYMFFISFL